MGFWDAVKKGTGIDLVQRLTNTGGAKDARNAMQPHQQFWGGSEGAYGAAQQNAQNGVSAANQAVNTGLDQNNRTAYDYQVATDALPQQTQDLGAAYGQVATSGQEGLDRNALLYGSDRAATLGNAGQLEALAQNAPAQYQQTDQAQFQAQQDANQRAALATAASGGAAGLRTALAGNQAANAQAAQQAQITRANNYNALLGYQAGALSNAAGIRAGVGSQDQALAGLYSQRQQVAQQGQGAAIDQRLGIANDTASVQSSAAQAQLGAGLQQQGNWLNQDQTINSSQLAANQAYDSTRRDQANKDYDYNYKPFGRLFGKS